METRLCGRFAPSPTGPLHQGSLVAALASFLDAKTTRAEWLVRMEDIDTPRTVPGAAAHILRSLEAHGLHWDGSVMLQSERLEAYREALAALADHVYPCGCSRRGVPGPYPGTCSMGLADGRRARAFRVRVPNEPVHYLDRLRGSFSEALQETCGDFIVLRADGIFAYQLAVVVDDVAQGVTDVVRGADLLDSTARQVHLYSLLQQAPPRYLHMPIVKGSDGEKLSKQTNAPPLDDSRPAQALWQAFEFLKHPPPPALRGAPPRDLLEWGVQHWDPLRLLPL